LCRKDHGLTWAEFQDITLAQLEALEERRAIQIRHARYDAALIAAAVLNANMPEGVEPVSPFDFLWGFEEPEEDRAARQHRKVLIKGIRHTLAAIASSPVEVQTMRTKIIERLRADGHEDAEQIMTEAFPNL
jgi:hypothetical protein